MMHRDALDRLAASGGDLLDRVDDLLARHGAPGDHAIWPLLRRLRALPGEAAAAVVALRPEPLVVAGAEVRGLLPGCAAATTGLTGEVDWQGAAAAAFESHRDALAAYLGAAPEGVPGRLAATAEYADAVAGWLVDTRMALARTLAEVLGSAEAAVVVTGRPQPAAGSPQRAAAEINQPQRAAAEIGVRVLATVTASYDEAETLLARWRPALAEVSYRPPSGDPLPLAASLRIGR